MLWALRFRGLVFRGDRGRMYRGHRVVARLGLRVPARRRASLISRSSSARWPWELLALPALALAHVFPETGAGLYLRLAAATLCLLVPGALVARALGQQSVFAALSWSLAGLTAASAMMFAVEGPLWWALALYAGIGAVALPFAVMRPLRRPSPFALGVAAAGIAVRHRALVDRRAARRRRALPPRPHPQARGVRQPRARVRERVRGRRAAPRLRVPALARAHGPRGLARRSRSPVPRSSTSRACSFPSRSSSPTRPAWRSSGRPGPASPRCSRPSRSPGSRRDGAARTRRSRCPRPRRATCSLRRRWPRSSSSSGSRGGPPGSRPPPPLSHSRSSTRRT